MNHTIHSVISHPGMLVCQSPHKIRKIQELEKFKNNQKEKFKSLTKREVEVLILLANDLNSWQVSETLFISRFTAEQHRKNINRKLGVNTPIQLYQYALAFDLV